ncbi:MAG TPA: c-type cytochrome [Acetobacteraceae bacterium]|nr:c-type cytochrome [Acetobacteraceae bacterium]
MPKQLAVACLAILALATAPASALAQSDPSLLERGRYLVEIVAYCGACHTTRGPQGQPLPGMENAGGRIFEERGFRAVAPNITPDPETGIGRWTEAQIADAIRNGRRPDGSLIGPPMPVESYRGISDRDLSAMVAYLRSIPPVRHAVTERSRYPFALEPHGPRVTSVPEPPEGDPVRRGEYIAVNLAHCMDCHAGQISEGRRDPARSGATGLVLEGPWGAVVACNISTHPELGIGRWTDEQIRGAITRGVSADGRRLAPPMGGRAPVWAQMTDRDLRDTIAYLRSLAPQDP